MVVSSKARISAIRSYIASRVSSLSSTLRRSVTAIGLLLHGRTCLGADATAPARFSVMWRDTSAAHRPGASLRWSRLRATCWRPRAVPVLGVRASRAIVAPWPHPPSPCPLCAAPRMRRRPVRRPPGQRRAAADHGRVLLRLVSGDVEAHAARDAVARALPVDEHQDRAHPPAGAAPGARAGRDRLLVGDRRPLRRPLPPASAADARPALARADGRLLRAGGRRRSVRRATRRRHHPHPGAGPLAGVPAGAREAGHLRV